MAMLIPLYLLTPIIYKVIDGFKNRWIPTLILMAVALSTNLFAGSGLPDDVWGNIQGVMMRLPSYFLGFGIAKGVMEDKKTSFGLLTIIIGSIMVALFALRCPIEYYLLPMLGLVLVFGYCTIRQYCDWKILQPFYRFMNWLGKISLESYLLNIFLPVFLVSLKWDGVSGGLLYGNYLLYAVVVALGLCLAPFVKKVCSFIK